MPNMADITVKKADGTTDVVYSAVQPSAGDKSPAVWVNATVGNVLAARPKFTFVASDNGTRKARRMRTTYIWPNALTDAAGNPVIRGGCSSESSHLVPQDMTMAVIDEYVAQYSGLLRSALIQSCTKQGYGPG